MIEGEKTLRVWVWLKPYTVSVHQKSEAVWIAAGDYKDERIETEGPTVSAAAAQWAEAARYRTKTFGRSD